MSRPIVVVACMIGSSVSWEPQQHPLLWHSRAGGGAVHSINSGHHRPFLRDPNWDSFSVVREGFAMKLHCRQFLHLAAGTALLPAASRIARAQTYPARPVRWIVGFPAGGPTDITARIMAEFLSERLHQQFAVENRPGAASNVATELVARAEPDGYTVMELATVNGINASLYKNLNYDFVRDIALVAGIAQGRPSWRQTQRYPSLRFVSSSPMPKPIRERSTWGQPALERRNTSSE